MKAVMLLRMRSPVGRLFAARTVCIAPGAPRKQAASELTITVSEKARSTLTGDVFTFHLRDHERGFGKDAATDREPCLRRD